MIRRFVHLVALVVPMPARERWREEWCAEVAAARAARGSMSAIKLLSGAARDAVTLRRIIVRNSRGPRNPFRGLREDVRDVLRSVRHSPGFALSVVASLGLGIAGMVTAFTLVNATLFRPFPGVRDQHELMKVWLLADVRYRGARVASFDDYMALSAGLTSFSGLAAQTTGDIAARIDGQAAAIRGAMVSDNYFEVLGVLPQAGRFFSKDPRRDDHGVVVLSHNAWVNRYGGRPDILGKTIELGAFGHAEIIGIAPPRVVGSSRGDVGIGRAPVELWVPIAIGRRVFPPPADVPSGADPEASREFQFTGRLRPGISESAARTEASVVAARIAAARKDRPNAAIEMEPVIWGHADQRLMFAASMLAVPALVLIIGCVNAANLLLARGTHQSRELSVRLALGATRWRVIRPLLLESWLLAGLAAAASLPIAQWAVSAVRVFIDIPMPIDARVMAFAVLLAFGSTIVFALLPSLRLSAVAPGTALGSSRPGDAGPGRGRGRRMLVVTQIALSAGLLATGGQLLTFLPAQFPSAGTAADRLVMVTLDTGQLRMSSPESADFYRRLLERVSTSAEADGVGLARAAAVWTFGMTRGYSQLSVWRPSDGPRGGGTWANGGYAGGELFRATGQRIVAGRAFNAGDRGSHPRTIIINTALAGKLYPAGALGQVLRVGPGNRRYQEGVEVTIVGVIEPVSEPTYTRNGPPVSAAYLPAPLETEPRLVLYAKARNSAQTLAAAIRAAVTDVDPRMPPIEVETLAGIAEQHLFPERLAARGVSLLGLIGLVLAAGGVYGTMSYFVGLRRKEIGVRIALGADPSAILRMTLGEALRLAAWGAVVGGFGAYVTSKLVQAEMHGVKALDPAVFLAAFGLIAVALIAASIVPARSAARVDPMAALRQE